MLERLPYGPDAVLLRFAERVDEAAFGRSRALAERLEAAPPPGLRAWSIAFTSVLLEFDGPVPPAVEALDAALDEPLPPSRVVEIPVVYDGEDLAEVARVHGLTPDDAARLHAAPLYRVHALGFSPGFGYLGGLDPRLATPRRATPRKRVPGGSVAIGGEHTGVYPLEGPGGWNLVGRTSMPMLDLTRDGEEAFALRTGDRVRFVSDGPDGLPGHDAPRSAHGEAVLEVVSPGPAASLRDGGRHARWRRFGVPPGGAMDPPAAARANARLGNPPGAPVLELLLGGTELRAVAPATLAIAGAASREGETRALAAGDRARIPVPAAGLWSYVAIEGGFAGGRRFGSVSPGPGGAWGTPIARGTSLARGERGRPSADTSGEAPVTTRSVSKAPLCVHRAPQWEAFAPAMRDRFLASEWTVTSVSDRAGYRLAGPALEVPAGDLASEPMRPGTIQVPPDGQPIATMPDGPTVGGYAKLAWIAPADLPRLAQARPGVAVRFRLAEDG